MNKNSINLLNQFNQKGYCIVPAVFNKNILKEADKEILNSDTTIKYYDKNQNLRRIECIYDKGPNLLLINKLLNDLLHSIFKKKFVLFKDKYNAKPAGGEGFFDHYDGIFNWIDFEGNQRNGWHVYANEFVNILVAIDDCTLKNGTIEIANIHKGDFCDLIKNTKMNGTPDLEYRLEQSISFEPILINSGDVVIFSSRCPHRSRKNKSKQDRRTIYYTYNPENEGDNYSLYFSDKSKSKNKTSKSLSGES